MASPIRVVLLRDRRWPAVPGVCCWRYGSRAAFAAAGAGVVELTCLPRAPSAGIPHRPAELLRWATGRGDRSKISRRLRGAGLVIAETLDAAATAVACGTPAWRVWALAVPTGQPLPTAGLTTGPAEGFWRVGGFLADSEATRDWLERSVPGVRPRVELFPPLAEDRTCPHCSDGCHPRDEAVPAAVAWLSHRRAAIRTSGDLDRPVSRTVVSQVRAARELLDGRSPGGCAGRRGTRSVLVTGFDLRFALDLAERLDRRPDLEVTADQWRRLGHPDRRTRSRFRRADAVVAEWARPNAVWASRRKRPDQFLAVRLHRYELDSPYPAGIAAENLDAVVYIAPLFGRRIAGELGWPAHKLVYIPNYLDLGWLDRPKLPGARFALGLVGIEWSRKRFDRALDLLAMIRREDPRFHLAVRSAMPWDNPYVWARPQERGYAIRCLERVERDPVLRGGVAFDPPGRDMARWYRRVGHILSTSDEEGSHMSVGEGMASGAVPVVRPWPGAVELYDPEWVHASTGEAAAALLESISGEVWAEKSARAKAEIRRTHDPAAVVDAWADLLHGDLVAARRHFAAYSAYSSLVGAECG